MSITRHEVQRLIDQAVSQIVDQLSPHAFTSPWLTVPEAEVYAKVKRATLLRWVDEGLIYGFKRTGDWIIDRQSIDDYYNTEKLNLAA